MRRFIPPLALLLASSAGLLCPACAASGGGDTTGDATAASSDARADVERDAGVADGRAGADVRADVDVVVDSGPVDAARGVDVADSGPRGHDASDATGAPDVTDAAAPVIDALDAAEASLDAADVSRPDAQETCSDGAPVAYTRTSCSGAPAGVPSALASAASSAAPGDVVALDGLDDSSLPCFPVRVCVADGAPTLLFSDDPESPDADGVLYADELAAGAYRAYVYHTNAGSGLRKFPVVLLNQGTATVHATITAEGIAGPSQDYVDVGKQALLRWLDSAGMSTVVDVPAGTRVSLDPKLDAVHASTDDLAHGILDFSLDGPVKLSVVSVEASEDAPTVTAGLSLLGDDGLHQRGSFPGAALEIEALAPVDGAGARHLRMGANVTDASLTGHDYVDGTDVTLDGNYGVSYAMNLALATGVRAVLLLSPQGGDWGGVGAVASGTTLLPSASDAVGSQTDAIALGELVGGGAAQVTFLSAGGSSLPVDLVTVPTP